VRNRWQMGACVVHEVSPNRYRMNTRVVQGGGIIGADANADGRAGMRMRPVPISPLVALLALTLGLALAGCSGKPPSQPVMDACAAEARPATVTSDVATFGRLRLRLPLGWYPVNPCQMNLSGFNVPLGFITTQPPVAQCSPGRRPGEVGCGPPIRKLGDEDTLVEVETARVQAGDFRPNAAVAGRPAMLTLKKVVKVGGSARFTVYALIRGTVHHRVRDYIIFSASAPADSADAQRKVMKMLRTAIYRA
jgi:hypothetical protein